MFEPDDDLKHNGNKAIFEDEDYNETNSKYNRVRTYSFSVGKLNQ